MTKEDELDRLCNILYGRSPKPGDYIGGSNAKVLHDAAEEIEKLRINRTDYIREGISIVAEWINILLENEYSDEYLLTQLIADMDHSNLLYRMADRKPIFNEPPPRSFSSPDYDLLDLKIGRRMVGSISGRDLYLNREPWRIEKRVGEHSYILRYYTNAVKGLSKAKLSSTLWKTSLAKGDDAEKFYYTLELYDYPIYCDNCYDKQWVYRCTSCWCSKSECHHVLNSRCDRDIVVLFMCPECVNSENASSKVLE